MIKKALNKINQSHIHRDLSITIVLGAISTFFDIAILNIFFRLVHTNIYIATLFGFLAGTAFGYPANNHWTYGRHNRKANVGGLVKCAIVGGMGLLFTEIIMSILNVKMGYHYNISKLVAVFIVFFWNFFANRYWTFRAPKVEVSSL